MWKSLFLDLFGLVGERKTLNKLVTFAFILTTVYVQQAQLLTYEEKEYRGTETRCKKRKLSYVVNHRTFF